MIVFKTEVRRESALDYRSLHRPRDIISYINCCLDISEGKEYIAPSAIQDAEKAYSLGRLRSLSIAIHKMLWRALEVAIPLRVTK